MVINWNNPEDVKKYHAAWREKHRVDINKKQIEYYWRNHDKCLKSMERYRNKDREEHNKRARDYNLQVKIKALNAYGGCKCNNCDIEDIEVLCIDHINDDGQVHRNKMGGKRMYNWLIKNNFPPGFQVLCRNCNWKKLLKWKRDNHK